MRRVNLSQLFPFLIIIAFSLTLRLYNLRDYPRWYIDEGTNIQLGVNLLSGWMGYRTWGPNFFPLLYDLMLGVIATLFGRDYFYTRLLGAFMGAASCVLIYIIGYKFYDKKVALLAALILCVAGLHINRMAHQHNGAEFFFLLTVLYSLKFKDGNKAKYLAGVFAGLALLSHFIGVIAIIFLLLRWFQGAPIEGMKEAIMKETIIGFLLVCLIFPLSGLLVDWNWFIYDMLKQASRSFDPLSFIKLITIMTPFNPETYQERPFLLPYPITYFGFMASVYVIFRRKKPDSEFISMLLAGFVGFLLAKSVWWSFLIMILPSYSLAISYVLSDIFNGVRNWIVLAIVALMCITPQHFFSWTHFLSLLAIILIASILYRESPRRTSMNKIRKMTKTFRTIIFLVILFSLPLVLIYDLRLVMRDDTVAQRIVVEYLNKHTNNDEMVAVNPSLIPPLECNAIPHEIVAFYVGKNPQFLYEDAETMLSRYRTDVNLSYFKYFVVDPRLSLGSYPNDFVVLEILTRSWLYVGGVGDNLIFLNPSYAIEELESIVHINSTENLKYAYGLNVEEPTIGSNGGIHFAAKSKVVKGWCFWKLKLQKPIDTSEGAIFAIKYKTNDAKIRVVAKFIHGRDEEVPGWFTDAQPPTSEYRISIHELSGNYTLSAVILGFDWAEHWVWGETRRELHIDFLSFNKGIGVKLSD